MSEIGLLQPDECEVQLAHDRVQPHQHVQRPKPGPGGSLQDHVKSSSCRFAVISIR